MGIALLKHVLQNTSQNSELKVAYNPADVGLSIKDVDNYIVFNAANMIETLKFIVVDHRIPYQSSLRGGYITVSKTKWKPIKEPKSEWSWTTASADVAYLSDTVSGTTHTTNIKCNYTNVDNVIYYLYL